MSSLRDVAATAGVSRMTVSNVINGRHHKVSPATIERVRRAIAELEYIPDAQARSLAAKRSRMIGLVIHHPDERRDLLENPHDAILVGAVERAVTAAGYSFITASSTDVVATARALGSWRTDGLIVYGSVADEINELERTQARPLVFLDNYSGDERVHVVGVDDYRGGVAAGEHLVELGHRHLAFAGPLDKATGVVAHRLDGLRAVIDSSPGTEIAQVVTADHGPRSAGSVVDQLLFSTPAPTAVVAASDVLATEIIGELFDRDIPVPARMSVVGFDDSVACRWIRPQLTSVAQDIPAKAAAAVDLLIRLIESGEPAQSIPSPGRLPMTLRARASTAPPSA